MLVAENATLLEPVPVLGVPQLLLFDCFFQNMSIGGTPTFGSREGLHVVNKAGAACKRENICTIKRTKQQLSRRARCYLRVWQKAFFKKAVP